MTEHKSLKVDITTEEGDGEGMVKAVFATLNVVDKDGDVTVPGAFKSGAEVMISDWNHTSWQNARPVGKGSIAEVGDEAIFTGKFFLMTAAGRDAFETVKALGPLGEWSYGYEPVKYSFGMFGDPERRVRFLEEQSVTEVSPVIKGAGENTRTLSAKGDGVTFAYEADAALAAVKALTDRAVDLRELRGKQGRKLGDTALERLKSLGVELDAAREAVAHALEDPADETKRLLLREELRSLASNVG